MSRCARGVRVHAPVRQELQHTCRGQLLPHVIGTCVAEHALRQSCRRAPCPAARPALPAPGGVLRASGQVGALGWLGRGGRGAGTLSLCPHHWGAVLLPGAHIISKAQPGAVWWPPRLMFPQGTGYKDCAEQSRWQEESGL